MTEPAPLEAFPDATWCALRNLAGVAAKWAPVFQGTATSLGTFLVVVDAAEQLRTSSAEVQAILAAALVAAVRDVASSIQSLTAAESLSKLNLLAIAPAGTEN